MTGVVGREPCSTRSTRMLTHASYSVQPLPASKLVPGDTETSVATTTASESRMRAPREWYSVKAGSPENRVFQNSSGESTGSGVKLSSGWLGQVLVALAAGVLDVPVGDWVSRAAG